MVLRAVPRRLSPDNVRGPVDRWTGLAVGLGDARLVCKITEVGGDAGMMLSAIRKSKATVATKERAAASTKVTKATKPE